MNPYLYLYLHIPKTGGVSLIRHFQKYMNFMEDFVLLSPEGDHAFKVLNEQPLHTWKQSRLDKVQVIMGHDVNSDVEKLFPEREIRRITTLRNPADMVESYYNYEVAKHGQKAGFWVWYKQRKKNLLCWWVQSYFPETFKKKPSFKYAANVLEDFWKVAAVENMDEALRYWIQYQLGLPWPPERKNVTGVDHKRCFSLLPTEKERIERYHEDDYRLWRLYL